MFAKFRSRYLVTELLPLPRVFYIIIPLIEPPPPLLAHSGRRLSIYPAPRPHLSPSLIPPFRFPLRATLLHFSPTSFDQFRPQAKNTHSFCPRLSRVSVKPSSFCPSSSFVPIFSSRYSDTGCVARDRTHDSASRDYMAKRQRRVVPRAVTARFPNAPPFFALLRSDIYDRVPSCSPAYLSLSANKSKRAGNSYQLAETWIAGGIPR